MADNKKGWEVLERAKSKKQTKPQTKEQSEFDGLHDFIKNYDGTSVNWLPFLTYGLGFMGEEREKFINVFRPEALTIMESAIFYGGGLKGGHLYGNHYEFYHIENLQQFIYKLSKLINRYKTRVSGWPSDFQTDCFAKGMEHLKIFWMGVQMFKGKQVAKPFKTMLRALMSLEKGVSDKPDIKPKVSRSALKQKVVNICCEHIQAPDSIMSKRIAELLMVFDIPATPEGIRELFKKK